jgi:hypothetical protein
MNLFLFSEIMQEFQVYPLKESYTQTKIVCLPRLD